MDYLYKIIILLCSLIFGYLIGSISNGIILSKFLYQKDVREYGSNNSGGTNMGRVFGHKIGLITIILDMIKQILTMWITYIFLKYVPVISNYHLESLGLIVSALGCVIGHCYPLYFQFKGGKAVACVAGLIIGSSWILLLIGIITFFTVLKLKKMVSLSSITSSIILSLLSFLFLIPATPTNFVYFNIRYSLYYSICLVICTIILVYRHKANIKRIINHEEKTIKWLK